MEKSEPTRQAGDEVETARIPAARIPAARIPAVRLDDVSAGFNYMVSDGSISSGTV